MKKRLQGEIFFLLSLLQFKRRDKSLPLIHLLSSIAATFLILRFY
jgi:hypothetical protein